MQCDALLLLTKQIDVSFSWVCPVINYEFCHNSVKVVCGSTWLSARGSIATYRYNEIHDQ